jgi:hypothetical protein
VAAKKTDEATEIDALTFDKEELVKPDDKYVPEGFEDVEDYLKDLRETYELDIQADADNRKAAVEDKKFVAGEQWDERVLQERQGLPCLTINTIPQFTAQLVGDWRENKNSVKVLPSTDGNKDVADIRADLIRSIWTKSRADRITDNAFESMVQCGDGAFRVVSSTLRMTSSIRTLSFSRLTTVCRSFGTDFQSTRLAVMPLVATSMTSSRGKSSRRNGQRPTLRPSPTRRRSLSMRWAG